MTDSNKKPVFDHVTLIGIGLIGSSLARAIKAEGLAETVTISDKNNDHLARAEELDLGTYYIADAAEAVKEADLVILCTPVGSFGAIAAAIGSSLKQGAIVSDVGSVKQSVVQDIGPHIPEGVHLVPGHPISGTEKSGPDAGFSSLFRDRWAILTPPTGTDEGAVKKMESFWEGCGSNLNRMTAEHHDKVLAITSHLPHLIAYTIVGTATDLKTHLKKEVIEFSAAGFRDFTRIAASDPVMWRDVCLLNRDAILEILQRFNEDLTALQRAIRWGEADTLETTFTRTRDIRRAIIDAHQDDYKKEE